MKIADLIGNLVDIFGQPKSEESPVIGGINVEIRNRPDVHAVSADQEDHTDTKIIPIQIQWLRLYNKNWNY